MRGKEREGTCARGWRQGRARGRRATETAGGTAWEVNALPLWLVSSLRRWDKISEVEKAVCPASLCSWDPLLRIRRCLHRLES